MGKRFARNIEDFICMNCGAHVKGNGYTDHCPVCLYSMHVDINPGDRKCTCLGVMKPLGSSLDRAGSFTIEYVCIECGAKKRVKAAPDDSEDALMALGSKAGL